MATTLDGIKVLEVASWTFVPAAGAVLADWGADVIKVEHPVTGDPQRGLIAMGLIPGGDSAVELHHRAAEQGQAQHRSGHHDRPWARVAVPAGTRERRVPHELSS